MSDFFERLLDRIKRDTIYEADCWVWTGNVNNSGYGQLSFEGSHLRVHAVSVAYYHGSASHRRQPIHHTCGNKRCWNPDHLQLKSAAEHNAIHPRRKRQPESLCKRGHPLTGDNVQVNERREGHPHRQCKACRRLRARKDWKP